MSRFKKFLAATGGLALAVSAATAQSPVFGEPSIGFPSGKVVSSGPTPVSVNPVPPSSVVSPASLPVLNAMPVPGQPTYTTGPMPGAAIMSGPVNGSQLTVPPSTTGLVPGAVPGTWVQSPLASCGNDCCGPVGAHGPIGWDTYFRVGPTVSFGDGLLAKVMNVGWMGVVGSRSLFFNQTGTGAWVVDPHFTIAYNNAGPDQLGFLRGDTGGDRLGPEEIVTVRNVLRYSAGIGVGYDWYSNLPGFVGGSWNAFHSYGLDAGGRWGTGHVDYQPITDPGGYRRTHDIFGQVFIGGNYHMNIPMGGWTFFWGGRAELSYTSSDLYPTGGSFFELSLLGSVGVRY